MGNGVPYFSNEKWKGGNGLRFTHCHPVAGVQICGRCLPRALPKCTRVTSGSTVSNTRLSFGSDTEMRLPLNLHTVYPNEIGKRSIERWF
jgi:hypothetical protein